jgi:hypothetical protein
MVRSLPGELLAGPWERYANMGSFDCGDLFASEKVSFAQDDKVVRIEEMRARSLARDEKRGARDDNVVGSLPREFLEGPWERYANMGSFDCGDLFASE